MSGAYIYDGYTEMFRLKEAPGLYEEINAEIRPKTAQEVSRMSAVIDKIDGETQRRRAADFLVPHVISWDLKDQKGDILPITVETLLRLRQQVYSWILNCVCGNVARLEEDRKN